MPVNIVTTHYKPEPIAMATPEDLLAITAAIREALAAAVNAGRNSDVAILLDPNTVLPAQGTMFLEGVEGNIVSSSMQGLEIVSYQGNRRLRVFFVGGGSFFGIAHPVNEEDAAEPEPEEEEPAAVVDFVPPVQAPVIQAPVDEEDGDDDSDATPDGLDDDETNGGDDDSSHSSWGDEFPGFSQLTM